MNPLDIVLTLAFAAMFLAAIVLGFREGSRATIGILVGGGLAIVMVVVLPLESLEWGPDGLTVKTRGPRTRDISIAVEALARGAR